MKLTNEEIAKVFAMYWGCEFWLCDNIEQNPVIEKVTASIIPEIEIGNWLGNEERPGELLLLTPLSKITDEDAVQVAKMFKICIEHTEHKAVHVYTILAVMFEMPITVGNDLLLGQFEAKEFVFIYQFLTSRGYTVPLWFAIDHPCNGMNAIELEIAIDKTTLK